MIFTEFLLLFPNYILKIKFTDHCSPRRFNFLSKFSINEKFANQQNRKIEWRIKWSISSAVITNNDNWSLIVHDLDCDQRTVKKPLDDIISMTFLLSSSQTSISSLLGARQNHRGKCSVRARLWCHPVLAPNQLHGELGKSQKFPSISINFLTLGSWTVTRGKERHKASSHQLGIGAGDTNHLIRVSPNDTSVISGLQNHLGFQSILQWLQQLLRLLAANVARTSAEEEGTALATSVDAPATATPLVPIAHHAHLWQESLFIAVIV